jgi:hypothetical protein
MPMAKADQHGSKEREANRVMEWEIIKDKLVQGINGVEWLILNITPKEHVKNSLSDWTEQIELFGHLSTKAVMVDALTMGSEDFYKRYEFNWWMSVSYTLTHLFLLKERNYEGYFDFLQTLEKKGGAYGAHREVTDN